MAGFSGSYRSQMEAASRAAQEEAAAAGEMSWSEINDMLGHADMMDAPFNPPSFDPGLLEKEVPDFGAMGPSSAYRFGSVLPEAAADAEAMALHGALALALGAAALQWFTQYTTYGDAPSPGKYNFGPEWTTAFSGAPVTNGVYGGKQRDLPYFKMGQFPAPPGTNSTNNPVSYMVVGQYSNGDYGVPLLANSTRVQFGTYYEPWAPTTNINGPDWTMVVYEKRTRGTGFPAVPIGMSSFPRAGKNPFNVPPQSTDVPLNGGGDVDHPSNKRNRWRPGPQDWPNIPRHHQGPTPPDQPPPGGSTGGGGASGGWNPQPPPDPSVWWPSLEDGPPPYKVPAHSYSNANDQWEQENDWHMLVPDYAIKILMEAGIYEKTHFFKSSKGLDDLYKILAKSIPDHPCVGLTGSARVKCVMANLDRVSWKHFAGQVGREAAKVEEPGVVRTPLPNWDRRAKKAFKAVRAVHNAVALGVKRSRVFSNRKGMF